MGQIIDDILLNNNNNNNKKKYKTKKTINIIKIRQQHNKMNNSKIISKIMALLAVSHTRYVSGSLTIPMKCFSNQP